MKQMIWPLILVLPVLLTACGGNEDFEGRYIGLDGGMSYEFMPDGEVNIAREDNVTTAQYEYDSSDQSITLKSDTPLPIDTLTVDEEGNLEAGDIRLTRGVDNTMLADSTWIGEEGQYSFALTFTQTEEGLETLSELVTYFDDDMTYSSQLDKSITHLHGNMLSLDMTRYTVSDVTEESFTITIGHNSMVLEKHPKGTEIEIREGYQSEDEAS